VLTLLPPYNPANVYDARIPIDKSVTVINTLFIPNAKPLVIRIETPPLLKLESSLVGANFSLV
jgi:hypothetical protein